VNDSRLQRLFVLQIERDCNFYVDFGSDTFTFMELVVKVEDEFGLNDFDFVNFDNVCIRSVWLWIFTWLGSRRHLPVPEGLFH
jgi:hypothetical protein